MLTGCAPVLPFTPPEPLAQPGWLAEPARPDKAALQTLFPLQSGDVWRWEVSRVRRTTTTFLFVVPVRNRSVTPIGTWTLTIGERAGKRFAATLQRVDDEATSTETLTLWHAKGRLMMQDAAGNTGVALQAFVPHDAVRGEQVPCSVPLLGVQASCNVAGGGARGLLPGPIRGELSRYGFGPGDDAIWASMATGFLLMPGHTSVSTVVDLLEAPVPPPDEEMPLFEAVQGQGRSWFGNAKSGAFRKNLSTASSPEDALNALMLVGPSAAMSHGDWVRSHFGEQWRVPILRIALRQHGSDDDRLVLLAEQLGEVPLEDRDRFGLLDTFDAPWARRQAGRMLSGHPGMRQVYLGGQTWAGLVEDLDPTAVRAAIDGQRIHADRHRLVDEVMQKLDPDAQVALARYALFHEPEDQRLSLLYAGHGWPEALPHEVKQELLSLFEKGYRRRYARQELW